MPLTGTGTPSCIVYNAWYNLNSCPLWGRELKRKLFHFLRFAIKFTPLTGTKKKDTLYTSLRNIKCVSFSYHLTYIILFSANNLFYTPLTHFFKFFASFSLLLLLI